MAPLRAGNLLVLTIAALPPAAIPLVTPTKILHLRPKPRPLAWAVVIRLPSPLWKKDKLSSTWDPVPDLIVSWPLAQWDQPGK